MEPRQHPQSDGRVVLVSSQFMSKGRVDPYAALRVPPQVANEHVASQGGPFAS
jgi:hypothetical protein